MSRRPSTFSQADVKRAIAAVQAATGEPTRRVEIDRAGRIIIIVGAEPASGARNEWDEVQ